LSAYPQKHDIALYIFYFDSSRGLGKILFTIIVIFGKLVSVMPVIKSAIKKAKQDIGAREHNRGIRDEYKEASKKVRKFAESNDLKKAGDALREAYSKIDRAAKRNIIHKNNASRRKARLALLFKKPETKNIQKTAK
jgi:small subunit ribosomal protein S20